MTPGQTFTLLVAFLRQFKLEGVCGKRFAIREIAPGFVEIDLTSEVAA
jgi:hypothetical protein